jgi:hypothetical protein
LKLETQNLEPGTSGSLRAMSVSLSCRRWQLIDPDTYNG